MLVLLSGVSGSGKDTIKKELIKRVANVVSLPSFTDRSPREGEIEGQEYHFVTTEKFKDMIENHELYEYDIHHDHYYGTSRKIMNEKIKSGKIIVKDIDVNGVEGTVVKISLMFTKLRTYKNEMIFIPNSVVGSSTIKNYTHEEFRRVEYTIGVSYDNDVEKVKTALTELLNEEPLVTKSEDIVVFVSDYAASSINFTFRAYTKCNDYLKCLFNLKDRLKAKLDQHNINIPYPQLDVYLKNK